MEIRKINVKQLIVKTHVPGADYVINPYIGCPCACQYCYATFMCRFYKTNQSWGQFLGVKQCDKLINKHQLIGKSLTLSTVTDAYNIYEKQYCVTRKILEQLIGVKCSLTILTKNDLVLRDMDLLKQMHDVNVAFSINTLDEGFKNDMDKASSIKKRLEALKILHRNNIKTTIFISPIFPEITDWKEIILKTKSFVDKYWFENLNLRSQYKTRILAYIGNRYPKLFPLYNQIYNKNDKSYWAKTSKEIDDFCKQQKVTCVNFFYHEMIRK